MTINYEKNKEYFNGTRYETKNGKKHYILGALAVLLLIFGWSFFKGFNLILLVACVAAAIIVSNKETKTIAIEPELTDADIDAQQYSIDTQEAIDMALDKFGLDADQFQEIDPIVLSGPYFKNITTDYKAIKGKDGRVRSTNSEVTVFLFSAQQVFKYNYRFSLIEPNEKSYSTDEYFYRDIVTVSTESDTIEYVEKIEKKHDPVTKTTTEVPVMARYSFEKFVMSTTGGTAVSCAVRTTGDSVMRSIQAMRQLLREKKSM